MARAGYVANAAAFPTTRNNPRARRMIVQRGLGAGSSISFVDIAPTPVFAGLQTCHDGVSRLMEVLSRMFAAITRQRARSVTGIFS